MTIVGDVFWIRAVQRSEVQARDGGEEEGEHRVIGLPEGPPSARRKKLNV